MNIDLMIKMANEIGAFWEGELGAEKGSTEVASHLRKYWEPRMRKQMIAYLAERHGAGLSDIALAGVTILRNNAAKEQAPEAPVPVK